MMNSTVTPVDAQVVVVGAGQSAVQLAESLRSGGHRGSITLIGEEPMLPYERPPLSKKYLLDQVDRNRLLLRPQAYYDEHAIVVLTGHRVTAIDRARRTVTTGVRTIAYDALVLATGASPRRLPNDVSGGLDNVFTLRTLYDVDELRAAATTGKNALVVGGGYIGLEAAAVLAKMGLSVTVLELADRILGRVASAETSNAFRSLHQGHGVRILEGVGLTALAGSRSVSHASLTDGTIVDADLVVVGVGITPVDELAADAGLETRNGIVVDSRGRTSDPRIWAIGDCASFPFGGAHIRLESVQHAREHASVVAGNLLGSDTPYTPIPWFWSDQYDVKLQIAGLNVGYDEVIVRQGRRPGAVSHWYFRDGRFIAVDAINDARSFAVGRRVLESGSALSPEIVADQALDLTDLTIRSDPHPQPRKKEFA